MDHPIILFLLTGIASTKGFVIACFMLLTCLVTLKQYRNAMLFCIMLIGLMVSTTVLKELFQIPRPLNGLITVSGYAFPSGHASGAMFLGLSICFLSKNLPPRIKLGVWFFVIALILIIGISRIAYKVHTPTQVLAGFVVGAFWAWLFMYVSNITNPLTNTQEKKKE